MICRCIIKRCSFQYSVSNNRIQSKTQHNSVSMEGTYHCKPSPVVVLGGTVRSISWYDHMIMNVFSQDNPSKKCGEQGTNLLEDMDVRDILE